VGRVLLSAVRPQPFFLAPQETRVVAAKATRSRYTMLFFIVKVFVLANIDKYLNIAK
jgi:hypothetical protein